MIALSLRLTLGEEERIGTDQQTAGVHSDKPLEHRLDFFADTGAKDRDPLANGVCRFLNSTLLACRVRKGWIQEHDNEVGVAYEIAQHAESLGPSAAEKNVTPVPLPPGRLNSHGAHASCGLHLPELVSL
jgi:hypothetical protein